MQILIPNYVESIINMLNEAGFAAYIVGGCVRDSLLGVEPKDWDICTDAEPKNVEELFAQTIPTGKKYGTITVVWTSEDGMREEHCEVTTMRYESDYTDGRRPDKIVYGKSIVDDLARRDFTINAMAYNPLTGLIDPFNGVKDLEDKTIKAVGDPQERFKEDALRIMRAIRFACKYKFTIEPDTIRAMVGNTDLLSNVSRERLHSEFLNILTYSKDNRDVLCDCAYIIAYILGIADKFKKQNKFCIYEWEDNQLINNLDTNDPINIKLFKILKLFKCKYEAEIWLRSYKYSNEVVKSVMKYYDINEFIDNNFDLIKKKFGYIEVFIKMMYKLFKYDYVIDFIINGCCKNINITYETLTNIATEPHRIEDLAITGDDLKVIGFRGKEIGDVLNQLTDLVIYEPGFNTTSLLLMQAWRLYETIDKM